MLLEQQKPTLQFAISKIIWNLRSSFQSKIKCSSFEILIENRTRSGNNWHLVNYPVDF